MKQNIIHIGLDVDDTQYHGSAFNKDTGEVIDFKCRPTLKGLLQQVGRMARHFKGHKIKLCYEASYVGYCLQRDLISNDIHCDIVSPSSIPSPRGKAIKTDRIDAGCMSSKDSGLQGITFKRDFQLIKFMFMQPSACSIADVAQPAFFA